jgi:hypothetical protein
VLLGGGGTDTIDGGDGDDIEIQFAAINGELQLAAANGDRVTSATAADAEWVLSHVRIVGGKTVITIDGKEYQLAVTDLSQLVDAAADVTATSEPATSEPDGAEVTTTTVPTASIGDFVWLDADGDGVQDAGEAGLPRTVIRLVDADGRHAGETVTDEGGRYELSPSTSGPFTLEVVLPAGYQPTLVDVGPDDAIDSDADPADVVVGPVETTVRVAVSNSGGIDSDLDIGLVALPEEPTAPDDTAGPTTTAAIAIETPTTTQPSTTAVPTTEPPTTTAAIPEPTEPVTVAPTEASPTTEATTSTSAPAG